MKSDQRNYVVVGVFVLAMLAGLIMWIVTLSGGGRAVDIYQTRFESVLGLTAGGTQVHFNGFPVGKIETIDRSSDGNPKLFVLGLSIAKGWRIPDDSVTEIVAASLLASNVLNVTRGESKAYIAPGDEIPSKEAVNLMAQVSAAASGFDEFLNESLMPQIDVIVADLRVAIDQINVLLSKDNTGRVGSILRNLEKVSGEVDELMNGIGGTRERLDQALAKVDGVLVNLDSLIAEVTGVVTDNEDDLAASVTDLHESLEALSRHTEAIASNLETTTRNMNEFSQQIREDPAILLRGRESADEPGGSK